MLKTIAIILTFLIIQLYLCNMRKISSEIENTICQEYKNNNGYELSRKFGIEIHTIYKILKRNKIFPSNRKLTPSQENNIIKLYLEGKHGYKIATELNVKYNLVYSTLNRNNIIIRPMSQLKRKYEINEHCFDSIDEEWKSYFLGLFYADGCLTKYSAKISLITDDKNILEILNRFIYPNRPLSSKIQKTFINSKNNKTYIGRPQSTLDITNKHINNRLRELGLCERKSLTLQFPTYQMIPEKLMTHFIRGYFDGDGCIQIRKWGQRFDIISSYDFCNSLLQWFKTNLQIEGKLEPRNKVCRLVVHNKKDIHALYHFLYDSSSIYLNRKYIKFKEIIDNLDWTKIERPHYSSTKYVTFDKRRNRWQVSKKTMGKCKFYGSFIKENDAIKIANMLIN
jgi:hypothetical protein